MRFEIALSTSCPVTTQNPSCRVLQRDRALLTQLVRLRRIRLAVLGRVLVELDDDPFVRCHRNPPVFGWPVGLRYWGCV